LSNSIKRTLTITKRRTRYRTMKKVDYSICPVCKRKIPYGKKLEHMKKHPAYKDDIKTEVLP